MRLTKNKTTTGRPISPRQWRRRRNQVGYWEQEHFSGGGVGDGIGLGRGDDDIDMGMVLITSNKNKKCITNKSV